MANARPAPPSAGKLEKYVLSHATSANIAVGRVRHWISYMMLSGVLDRAARRRGGPRFIVKGGVALELRLRSRARATADLDVVAVCDEDNIVAALDDALREPYHDCTFSRRAETRALGEHAIRVWVQIAYRSQRWATVQVDLAPADDIDVETERLPGIPLSAFGLTGPPDVVCLSLRFHVAQKFHGMTKTSDDGRDNDRFRDAVDLLLLKNLIPRDDLAAVRNACEDTFRIRAKHTWPPAIALPGHWSGPFRSMAASVGLETTSLEDAQRELQALLDAILRGD